MRTPIPFLVLAITFSLLAASCGSGDTVDAGAGSAGSTSPSIAGRWILDSLAVDGLDIAVLENVELTIENGVIRGSGGCNTFSGTIDRSDGGSVTVSDLAITEMACVEVGRMAFEGRYVQALAEVDRWVAGPTVLTLASPTATLTYVPADPS